MQTLQDIISELEYPIQMHYDDIVITFKSKYTVKDTFLSWNVISRETMPGVGTKLILDTDKRSTLEDLFLLVKGSN